MEQEFQQIPQPAKNNQLLLSVISVVLTAVIVGSGVYFWQQKKLGSLQKNYEGQIQQLKQQSSEVDQENTVAQPTPQSLTGDYLQFKDDVLGIEFSYPKNWGVIKGELKCPGSPNYFDEGCRYDFAFNDQVGGSALGYGRITAGGRSADYSAGRGGYIVDFARGFEGKTPQQICQSFGSSVCNIISPKIISMTIVPKYEDICPPNPGQYPFSKVVFIDLGNKKVNGLLFEDSFLSDTANKELYDLFGNDFEKCYMADPDNIDTAMQKLFNDKANEILQRTKNRTIDQITLTNADGFDYFVNSFRIK